jgi:hypothetical protein
MTTTSLTTPSVATRPLGMTVRRVLAAAAIVLLAGLTFLLGHVTSSSTSSPTRAPATSSHIYAPPRADYPNTCELSRGVPKPC